MRAKPKMRFIIGTKKQPTAISVCSQYQKRAQKCPYCGKATVRYSPSMSPIRCSRFLFGIRRSANWATRGGLLLLNGSARLSEARIVATTDSVNTSGEDSEEAAARPHGLKNIT